MSSKPSGDVHVYHPPRSSFALASFFLPFFFFGSSGARRGFRASAWNLGACVTLYPLGAS
eukprot:10722-Pelagococcus_subviridis.AAC.5